MNLTPGQLLLLQQIQLVGTVRRWDIRKTIKKLKEVTHFLQVMQAQAGKSKKADDPPPTKSEAKLIEQAEQILKDMMKGDAGSGTG